MDDWFKAKTAATDAFIAAVSSLFVWFFLGELLGLAGMVAVVAGAWGFFQLLRYINAQLAALQWAKMQEAGLSPKTSPAVRGDGYREAAERPDERSVDDEFHEREIPRRRRRAKVSLGIIAGVAALATLVPGFAFGAWHVPGILGAITLLMLAFHFGMSQTRRREAQHADFFMEHLRKDTRAAIEKKRVVAGAEEPHLRVGVDFGVPQREIEAPAAADEADERRAVERRMSARGPR